MILTKSSRDLYENYRDRMRKIADIRHAAAVLQWDEETYLPAKGATFRGQQLATLSETAHTWFTAPELGEMLQELHERQDLEKDEQRNVALSLEDYTRLKKFSPAFVRLLSETASRSFHAWVRARSANSFALFTEDLEKLVQLKREEAELAGYTGHPYDALLDEYEKGATVSMIDKVFDQIRTPLKELMDRIHARQDADTTFLHRHYPRQQQWDFGMNLIRQLGFDLEAGRQDLSEHPFTTSFSNQDVRITTRIDENDLGHMTWSCIHETGHALYEQGLPEVYYGLPLGEYASLSIHESQSRLWENNVGRSLRWWEYEYPLLQRVFPAQLGDITLDHFYKSINKVGSSLIRTESDEVSYHFHVMIRYEIEKNLIRGDLSVQHIPAYWEDLYKSLLDVDVPDDKHGCLQDVHWSHGSFGYFSTYSLGSFYAAQFFAAATRDMPGLVSDMGRGHTAPLLDWLRKNIHCFGRQYTSEELCQKATGEALNIQYFLSYLLDKYEKICQF